MNNNNVLRDVGQCMVNTGGNKITLDRYRQTIYMIIMVPHELKQWREKTGYSQGQLARVLEVDVMTVSRWERGIMGIPSFLKWALAYLELKGDDLKPKLKRVRTGKKGGKENGSTGRVSNMPQKTESK